MQLLEVEEDPKVAGSLLLGRYPADPEVAGIGIESRCCWNLKRIRGLLELEEDPEVVGIGRGSDVVGIGR